MWHNNAIKKASLGGANGWIIRRVQSTSFGPSEWKSEPSVFQINVLNFWGPGAKIVILKALNYCLNTGTPKWQRTLLLMSPFSRCFTFCFCAFITQPELSILIPTCLQTPVQINKLPIPQLKSSMDLSPGICKQIETGLEAAVHSLVEILFI